MLLHIPFSLLSIESPELTQMQLMAFEMSSFEGKLNLIKSILLSHLAQTSSSSRYCPHPPCHICCCCMTQIVKAVSLHVDPGSMIGVVGSSGAGKSTLISLLERFHDCSSGQVRIDGVPIQQYNLKWLRRQIGLVSQEPKLFDASVAENILVGRPSASMDEVRAAAAAANADKFVSNLAQGYDTRVGEGGSQLSGGQKQRIAIARAILKNPRIILLDEATSALDSESEQLVQDALQLLMQNRTTIVIAHRLSTIRNSDTILVMEKGSVAEEGKHFDLLRERGLYYGLVVKQMSDNEREDLKKSVQLNPFFESDQTMNL